jgi:DnaJ-like protein
VPAWLIQLLISLLGGGSGGGPLPALAMVLLLAAAIPAGILALHSATIPGPLAREQRDEVPTDDGAAGEWGEPDPQDERQARADSSVASEQEQPLGWAYEALELDPSASLQEIKVAYRRLAQLYHPDHNPGFTQQAAERFASINAAYEALLDAREGGLSRCLASGRPLGDRQSRVAGRPQARCWGG